MLKNPEKKNERKFEVLNNKTISWEEIDLKDIKKGDQFRIFDDGKRVTDLNGHNVWTAISNPYINKKGIWTVNTRPKKIKVGRNAPCPCGSGKKYKKCCETKGGAEKNGRPKSSNS